MLVDHSDALEECSRFVLSDEGCLAGSHRGGERRQPAVPAWCSADRMRTCAPWSRLVAELPDYGDRLLSNSQLMANDQRPYGWRLWALQRARPGLVASRSADRCYSGGKDTDVRTRVAGPTNSRPATSR